MKRYILNMEGFVSVFEVPYKQINFTRLKQTSIHAFSKFCAVFVAVLYSILTTNPVPSPELTQST